MKPRSFHIILVICCLLSHSTWAQDSGTDFEGCAYASTGVVWKTDVDSLTLYKRLSHVYYTNFGDSITLQIRKGAAVAMMLQDYARLARMHRINYVDQYADYSFMIHPYGKKDPKITAYNDSMRAKNIANKKRYAAQVAENNRITDSVNVYEDFMDKKYQAEIDLEKEVIKELKAIGKKDRKNIRRTSADMSTRPNGLIDITFSIINNRGIDTQTYIFKVKGIRKDQLPRIRELLRSLKFAC